MEAVEYKKGRVVLPCERLQALKGNTQIKYWRWNWCGDWHMIDYASWMYCCSGWHWQAEWQGLGTASCKPQLMHLCGLGLDAIQFFCPCKAFLSVAGSESVAVRSFWLQRSLVVCILRSNRESLFRFLCKNGIRTYGATPAAMKLVKMFITKKNP